MVVVENTAVIITCLISRWEFLSLQVSFAYVFCITETGLGVLCLLILLCVHIWGVYSSCVTLWCMMDGFGQSRWGGTQVTGWGRTAEQQTDWLPIPPGLDAACGCRNTLLHCATHSCECVLLLRLNEEKTSEEAPHWRLSTRSQGLCISSNLVFYSHLVNGVSDSLLLVQLLLLLLLVTTSHTSTILSTMQS